MLHAYATSKMTHVYHTVVPAALQQYMATAFQEENVAQKKSALCSSEPLVGSILMLAEGLSSSVPGPLPAPSELLYCIFYSCNEPTM